MEIDPVCGMEVDPATAAWKWGLPGHHVLLLREGLHDNFMEDPDSYVLG